MEEFQAHDFEGDHADVADNQDVVEGEEGLPLPGSTARGGAERRGGGVEV